MSINTVWSEETHVKTSETDFHKQWKISGFFSAMIEAASHHASHLGFDYRDMLQDEMVWILSRLKICFHAFPLVGETVAIQTWPKGIQQKLFFMRDYQFTGKDGAQIASATSAYLLVNTQARRILPPQALPGQIPNNNGLSAVEEPLEKIPVGEALETIFKTRAGYSAVDLMGHVNNTRYVDWISDCFSFEEHQAQKLCWLQINFVNEVRPGESVSLARGQRPGLPGHWYVTGTNLDTGAKAFDAEIYWE